jgi:hypothetical protein
MVPVDESSPPHREKGDPSRTRDFLPADKQYLITRNGESHHPLEARLPPPLLYPRARASVSSCARLPRAVTVVPRTGHLAMTNFSCPIIITC